MAAQQDRLSRHWHLHAANAKRGPVGAGGQVVHHRLHGRGIGGRAPGNAQAELEQRVVQQALLDHLVGKPEMPSVKNLELGLHAEFRDAFGTSTQGRRGGHVNGVTVAEIQRAAIERADVRQQFLHMHQPRQRADQIGGRAKVQRRLTATDFQVAPHAGRQVDDDVHTRVADARHHLAVQGRVTAALAGLRVTHMAVHHGGTGLGRLHRRRGDLRGRDGNGRMFVHRVAGAG